MEIFAPWTMYPLGGDRASFDDVEAEPRLRGKACQCTLAQLSLTISNHGGKCSAIVSIPVDKAAWSGL